MEFFNNILNALQSKFEQDQNIIAFYITGSVARGEAKKGNDLDVTLLLKEGVDKASYTKEYYIENSLIEINSYTFEGLMRKLDVNPMCTYMILDMKNIFERERLLDLLKQKAQEILGNYHPTTEEINGIKKWLTATLDKIKAARNDDDKLKVGYLVSNILWKTLEGLYLINFMPIPAATSAYKRVFSLKLLPDNFKNLWRDALLGNIDERTNSTIDLIGFVLENLNKLEEISH